MKYLNTILIVLMLALPACGGPAESKTAAEQALANLDKEWSESYAKLKLERDGHVKSSAEAIKAKDAEIAALKATIAQLTVKPGPAAQAGNVFYVAPNGNDGNVGTQAKPFKTITAAIKVAKPGTTMWVAKGDYEEALPKFSGEPGKRIAVRAINPSTFVVNRDKDGRIVSTSGKATATLRGNESLLQAIGPDSKYVEFSGFTVEGYNSGYSPAECAVSPGVGSAVSNLWIKNNVGGGLGFSQSHGTIASDILSEDQGLDGLQGAWTDGLQLTRVYTTRNGKGHKLNAARAKKQPTWYWEVGSDGKQKAGTGIFAKNRDREEAKFSQLDNAVFNECVFDGNYGGGDLWFDVINFGRTMNNTYVGVLKDEMSKGKLTLNNCTVRWFGVWDTEGVEINGGTYRDIILRLSAGTRSSTYYATGQEFKGISLRNIAIKPDVVSYIGTQGDAFDDAKVAKDRNIVIQAKKYLGNPDGVVMQFRNTRIKSAAELENFGKSIGVVWK